MASPGGEALLALDTSVLRRLKPNSDAIRLLADRALQGRPFGLPTAAFAEICFGVYQLGPAARGYKDLLSRLNWLERHANRGTVTWIPLTNVAARQLGRLRAELPTPSKGHDAIGWLFDLALVATAWAAGYDIVTDNLNDFRVIAATMPVGSVPFEVRLPIDVGF